jgi:hypothetical protein
VVKYTQQLLSTPPQTAAVAAPVIVPKGRKTPLGFIGLVQQKETCLVFAFQEHTNP